MIELFLAYFSILAFCILLFAITGFYLFRWLGVKLQLERGSFLLSVFLGINSFVIIVSVFFTKGMTVNIILIPLWIFFIRELRNKQIFQDADSDVFQIIRSFRHIFPDVLFLLLIFSLAFFRNVDGGDFPFVLISTDDCFYSEVSQFLILTGKENIYNALNFISSDYHGLTLYHYFDLWLNAGISHLFGIYNMRALLLITYPFFYFLLFQGYLLLMEHYGIKVKARFIVAFLMLFLGGIIYYNYSSNLILNAAALYLSNIFAYPKLGIVYFTLILFTWFVLKRRKDLALMIISMLPVFYFTTAPIVYGTLILILLMYRRIFDFKDWKKALTCSLLSCVLLFLFYLLFWNKIVNFSNRIYFYELFDIKDLKVFFRKLIPFVHPIIFTPLTHLHFLILIGGAILLQRIPIQKAFDEDIKFLFAVFVISSFAGVSMWSLAYYNPDSFQLSQNFSSPFFDILLVLIIIRVFIISRIRVKLLFLSIIIFALYFNANHTFFGIPSHSAEPFVNMKKMLKLDISYASKKPSREYLSFIKGFFNSRAQNKIGVSLNHPNDYINIHDKTVTVNHMGAYLKYRGNGFALIGINDFDIPLSDEKEAFEVGSMAYERKIEENLLETFAFYRFVKQQKEENTFLNIEKSQLDFIRKYKIEYLIASSRAVVPQSIKYLIKEEIRDPVTGDRFCVLSE